MAYIEERKTKSGRTKYKAQVRLKGYPIQTATFERLTDARRWAKQIESAMLEGRHFKTSESKKRTFKELIERYEREVLPNKPKARQESQYKWWKEHLGHYVLADITPALIGEYRDKLLRGLTAKGTPRTPGTVLRYMAALSHAYKIARDEWEWIDQSPIDKVRKPRASRGRVRFLSDDERVALLEECKKSSNKDLYFIVILALSTGMRKSEILNLQWDTSVDLERNRIIVQDSKNGDRRSIPLAGLALELMRKRRLESPFDTGLVFPSQKEQKPQKPIDIRSVWETAIRNAKIADFKFHDLRHSAASYLAMSGASLVEIAEVLGHRTLSMVRRYSHLSEEHTSNVVSRMNDKLFVVGQE